jgi:hypothetical protein
MQCNANANTAIRFNHKDVVCISILYKCGELWVDKLSLEWLTI